MLDPTQTIAKDSRPPKRFGLSKETIDLIDKNKRLLRERLKPLQ